MDFRFVVFQVDVFFVLCLIVRCRRQVILQCISNGSPHALTAALLFSTDTWLVTLFYLYLYVLPSYLLAISVSFFFFSFGYFIIFTHYFSFRLSVTYVFLCVRQCFSYSVT